MIYAENIVSFYSHYHQRIEQTNRNLCHDMQIKKIIWTKNVWKLYLVWLMLKSNGFKPKSQCYLLVLESMCSLQWFPSQIFLWNINAKPAEIICCHDWHVTSWIMQIQPEKAFIVRFRKFIHSFLSDFQSQFNFFEIDAFHLLCGNQFSLSGKFPIDSNLCRNILTNLLSFVSLPTILFNFESFRFVISKLFNIFFVWIFLLFERHKINLQTSKWNIFFVHVIKLNTCLMSYALIC